MKKPRKETELDKHLREINATLKIIDDTNKTQNTILQNLITSVKKLEDSQLKVWEGNKRIQ